MTLTLHVLLAVDDVKYVFSAKIWFVKIWIGVYELQVVKSNPEKRPLLISHVYCSFSVDYTVLVYIMTNPRNTVWFIYVAALPFLVNWNQAM